PTAEPYTLSLPDALPILAGNVVPDEATVTINHRFAPDRTPQQALDHVRKVFDGYDLTLVDEAAGVLPRLSEPAAAELVRAAGGRSEEHTSELQSRENLVC